MKIAARLSILVALAAFALAAPHKPARADDHGHSDHWHGDHGGYGDHGYGGDQHHFHDRDEHIWRGGRWFHGDHDGRAGWWWIVNGGWYFYPRPIYPYPNTYAPPVVAPAPPAGGFWYYCYNPPGYYPYVPRCATRWVAVPASPG